MLEALMPKNFLEALGGVLVFISVVCLFLSLRDVWRNHAMRAFALLIILAVALITNYWVTYFAAMFIVATAATELEFLQNLAAIIRGNKDYFDYKSGLINRKHVEQETHRIGDGDV